MDPITKTVIPPLEVVLKTLGIPGNPEKAVPRQVTLTPLDAPENTIVATATGMELDRVNGFVRVALTGGLHIGRPLKCILLKGFDGDGLVWDAVFHNPDERSFKVKAKFGPAIGF